MIERAYTVAEIDDLRRACEDRFSYGTACIATMPVPKGGVRGRPYRAEEKAIEVEQMVRTHMLAGHTGDDLRKADEER